MQWKSHEIDYLPGKDRVVSVSISVLTSVLVSVPGKSVVKDAIGSPKTSIQSFVWYTFLYNEYRLLDGNFYFTSYISPMSLYISPRAVRANIGCDINASDV